LVVSRGTDGSNPVPSRSESTANPTSSGADDPECFGLQGHGAGAVAWLTKLATSLLRSQLCCSRRFFLRHQNRRSAHFVTHAGDDHRRRRDVAACHVIMEPTTEIAVAHIGPQRSVQRTTLSSVKYARRIGDRLQRISLQRGFGSLATRASCERSELTRNRSIPSDSGR
jgi:hypothetical protein